MPVPSLMRRRRVIEERITYVGLDDHKDEIAVADGGRRGEVREYGRIANTPAALRRLVHKLGQEGVELRFCYEDRIIPARRSGFAKLDGSCGATVHRRINRRTRYVLHWHRCFDEGECALHPGRQRQNRARDQAAADPEIIARFIAATGLAIERIGLESGCTAAWLFSGLQRYG